MTDKCGGVFLIPAVNSTQKHGSRAGEASKTTGSGYRFALADGCSILKQIGSYLGITFYYLQIIF